MIYVEILGRMGNQMFSYAFARYIQSKSIKQRNTKIALDFTNFTYATGDWKNDLLHFKCSSNIEEAHRRLSVFQRAVLWLYYTRKPRFKNEAEHNKYESKYRKLLNWFGIYICSYNYYPFMIDNKWKNNLLIGWFESSAFFKEIDDIIKDEFSLSGGVALSRKQMDLLTQVKETQSVCMGVRKGDFESAGNRALCSVCDKKYYETAIAVMRTHQPEAKFFVFTDEPDWVRDNVALPEGAVLIVDSAYALSNYVKLSIMSQCKNYIISNSTFEWWAQHLSSNANKIVIAPSRWRNITPETHLGIYEDEWIKISV